MCGTQVNYPGCGLLIRPSGLRNHKEVEVGAGWGETGIYSHHKSGLSGQFSGELEGRAPRGGIQGQRGLGGIKAGQSLSAEAPVFTGGASSEDNLATPGAVNDVEQDGGTIEGVESLQCPAVAEPKDHFGSSKFATCCFDQQQHDELREEKELSWLIR